MDRRPRALLAAAVTFAIALAGTASVQAQENAAGVDVSALSGQEFTAKVAIFDDPGGTSATDFAARIDWGDGTTASGSIVQLPSCPPPVDRICYEVHGAHTYAAAGTFPLEVLIVGPGGSATATATATVTDPPPPPPSAPNPPGPAPAAPTARLKLPQQQVKRGAVATLDASATAGSVSFYAFDLNGNGTYETKCETPYAGVLHTKGGLKQVGVLAVGSGGASSATGALNVIAGASQPPPKGQSALEKGTVTGVCLEGDSVADLVAGQIAAYECPITVQVGVAEATIPPALSPSSKEGKCFKREDNPPNSLKNPHYPRFVAGTTRVLVNGIEIDTKPNPKASNNPLILFETLKWVSQKYPNWQPVVMRLSKPGLGGIRSEWVDLGTWNVANPGVVGSFPIGDDLGEPEFMGLPVVEKDTPIKFTGGGWSELDVYVTPPFTALGQAPSPTGAPLLLRANNSDGLQISGEILGNGGSGATGPGGSWHIEMELGIFHLAGDLHFSKEGASSVWSGNVHLAIPNTPLDNIKGSIKFRDGKFEQSNVSAAFVPGGVGPIFCCFYLVQLNGELKTSSIEAAATFAAGPELWGNTRAAEATATMTIHYSPFLLSFVADPLKIASWQIGAKAQVVITSSSFMTQAFWVGGLGPLSWRLNVLAQIGSPWYIVGGGTACADVFPFYLLGDSCAAVYGGAGPKGVTACAGIVIAGEKLAGGVRVPWNPISITDYSLYTGCSFETAKSKVSASQAQALRATARAAAVAPSYPVRVPAGQRAGLFLIEGAGAQPQVTLRGPGGARVTTPPPGVDTTKGRNWLAVRDTNDNSVVVYVVRPSRGRWTVSELPGSPRVRSVDFAKALPERFVRARVSGKGTVRTLHYRVRAAVGTRVTFIERGGKAPPPGQTVDPEQLVEQVIGTAKRGSGRIRFRLGEAKVRARRIVAVVESQGVPIKTETPARFRAPKFRLPAAPRVKLRRRGAKLLVGWSRVEGADSYQAIVDQSDGPTYSFRRRANRRPLSVSGLTDRSGAMVAVRAISPAGYIGKAGVAKLDKRPAIAAPRRLSTARVLRAGGFNARCIPSGNGRCQIAAVNGKRILAKGSEQTSYGRSKRVWVKLTKAGRKALVKVSRSGELKTRLQAEVPGDGLIEQKLRFEGRGALRPMRGSKPRR
jgi:hypothetical protein